MKPQTIVSLVIGLLITILVIQNTHSVALKIFFWQPEIPLVILIAIVLAVGFIAGMFVKSIAGSSLKKKDEY
jgi:uncharacterized integral membrane protein